MEIIEEAKANRCPCCRHQVEKLDVRMLVAVCGVSDSQTAILRAVWGGKGYPVSTERIFDAMYADDPDGGPSRSAMYNSFKIALCRLRKRIKGAGVYIEKDNHGRGYRLKLQSPPQLAPLKVMQEPAAPKQRKPLQSRVTPIKAQLALAL